MKTTSAIRIVLLTLMVLTVPCPLTHAQLALTDGAENLASQIAIAIKNEQKQKIAVLPFRELTGRANYFGTYLAEDLITRLFQLGDFDIVERSMLDQLLEEMKLGESGLIDPETAKEVGKIAGVDAVVTGTMTELPSSIAVNCRLIDVETGRVFAAAQTRIFKDNDVVQIWNTAAPSAQNVQIGNGEKTEPTGTGGGGTESDGAKESENEQKFVTTDYTLIAKNLKVRGSTAELELVVTSERDEIIRFGIWQPYLLDSDGNRLELLDADSGGFVERGVELLPHSTLKSRLVFGRGGSSSVRMRRFTTGAEAARPSIRGEEFTFAASELGQGYSRGQKIIIEVHATR